MLPVTPSCIEQASIDDSKHDNSFLISAKEKNGENQAYKKKV